MCDAQILEYIETEVRQHGRKNPVSRIELYNKLGVPDRVIRYGIAILQEQGKPIISLVKGYFWGDAEQIEIYCQREKRRAISILVKLTHLKPKIKETIGQLELL